MSDEESAGTCEQCGKQLTGHLGVFDMEMCGVPVIAIREISRRNWICCDACGRLLCHDCCTRPEGGYCDACAAAYSKPITPPSGEDDYAVVNRCTQE
jgi:hypothetical protein